MALVREKGMFSFYEDGHTECCRVRKVKPLRRQLKTLTAWMTGQRKDQSPGTRQAVPVVQVDPVFEGSAGGPGSLVKFNPLSNVTSAADDEKATLVALYAPWCQYSQAMEQAYEELASRYAGHPRVRVAAFRADEAEHRPFAEKELGLKTFPTVVMLPRGSKRVVKYDSEARDVESLEMFLRALGTTSE